MWSPTARAQHRRAGLRYGSDVTDAEWISLEPHLPSACRVDRRRRWPMRAIVEAIFYALRAGCPWRLLPDSFPPWRAVYRWFARLRDDGVLEQLNHALVQADRVRAGRQPCPSAAVIDSQSVKATEARGPRGYDAGKKINGRKRHAMVDTDGRLLDLHVSRDDIQDRDGAVPLLIASRRPDPFVERAYADSAYNSPQVADATVITIEIVRKIADQVGFVVHPRRWSSSAPSLGSAATAVCHAIPGQQSPRPKPSPTPRPPCSSPEDWLVADEIRDGHLTGRGDFDPFIHPEGTVK